MKFKKFVSVFAALMAAIVCTFSLAACGGNDNLGTTEELKKDENGNVVFDDVELRFSTVVSGTDKTALQQIVNDFNDEYDGKIYIAMTPISSHTFENTVMSQIKFDNNAPDLIMSHNKSHKQFLDNNYIRPLNDIMELSGIKVNLSDYAEGIAKYSSLGQDGKMYNVPIDIQSLMVYYNKDTLAKYGEVPTNREELIAICTEYAEDTGELPISWATDYDFFYNYLCMTAFMQNGAKMYNTSNYKAEWTTEPNLQAFKDGIASVRGLIKHVPQLAQGDLSETASTNLFIQDKCLFYVTVPWGLDDLAAAYAKNHSGMTAAKVKSEVLGATSLSRWFALDQTKDYAEKVYGESHAFAMTKTCRDVNKQAAIMEFIKWFTQNGKQGAKWAAAGHISVSKIISESDEYKNNSDVKNFISKGYPGIDKFECVGITPFYDELGKRFTSLITNTINKNTADDDFNQIKTAQDNYNSAVEFAEM